MKLLPDSTTLKEIRGIVKNDRFLSHIKIPRGYMKVADRKRIIQQINANSLAQSVAFDVDVKYRADSKVIYAALIRISSLGPGIISQNIAEFAASERKRCFGCKADKFMPETMECVKCRVPFCAQCESKMVKGHCKFCTLKCVCGNLVKYDDQRCGHCWCEEECTKCLQRGNWWRNNGRPLVVYTTECSCHPRVYC